MEKEVSIYDLYKKVQQHPDFRAGVIFTEADNSKPLTREERKYIEEAMTVIGFAHLGELEPPKGNVPPSERLVITDTDRELLA